VIHDMRGFAPEYAQCVTFLYREAELLDDRRLSDWLTLLSNDIDYRIPTRVTQERSAASEFSTTSFHLHESFGSLRARVKRFETDFAYVEDPPTRTRRMISNVRLAEGPAADGLAVRSNFLLVRVKRDDPAQLLSGERHDVLRFEGPDLKLARRVVLLDHSALPMENLAVFL
jgi:3-phenylpropionate/cinnamic acid dioxygenase small subunit